MATSSPIRTVYTRQIREQTRQRTSIAPNDGLDESSLAPWWNADRYINSNVNSTPFRKQNYEPLRWDNLLEEDGASFLLDDPYATPGPSRPQSVRKTASVKRRKSSLTAQLKNSRSSLASPHAQRPLTLADLTPRSRRISAGRRNRTPKARRSSAGQARALHLSANGPGFGPSISEALHPIEESPRREATPLRDPSLPNTPLQDLNSPRPAPTSRKPRKSAREFITEVQEEDLHTRLEQTNPTPAKNPHPQSVDKSVKARRKSKRHSIVPNLPATQLIVVEDEGDDEQLHRSIPGAFDFTPHKGDPLPNAVLTFLQTVASEQEPALAPKSRPASRRPSEVAQPRPRRSSAAQTSLIPAEEAEDQSTIPAPELPLTGFAGKLAEYGDMLMGFIGPTQAALNRPSQLPVKKGAPRVPDLKLSDLSPQKRKSAIPTKLERKLHVPSRSPRPSNLMAKRPTLKQPVPVTSKGAAPVKSLMPRPVAHPKKAPEPTPTSARANQPPLLRQPSLPALAPLSSQEHTTRAQEEVEATPVIELLPAFESAAPTAPVQYGVPPSPPRTRSPSPPPERLARESQMRDQTPSTDVVNVQQVTSGEHIPYARGLELEQLRIQPVTTLAVAHPEPSRQRRSSAAPKSANNVDWAEALEAELEKLASTEPMSKQTERPAEPKRTEKLGTVNKGKETTKEKRDKRPIKPILKKRPLEASPAKRTEERAAKRQRLGDATTTINTKAIKSTQRDLTLAPTTSRSEKEAERGRGRANTERREEVHRAFEKSKSRSRPVPVAENEELAPAIAPLVFAPVPEPSTSRPRPRSISRESREPPPTVVGEEMAMEDVEEDVFGSVIENSIVERCVDLCEPASHTDSRPLDHVPVSEPDPQPALLSLPEASFAVSSTPRHTSPNVPQAAIVHDLVQPPRRHNAIPPHVQDVARPMEELLPERLFGYKFRENESCRLTVPQSPRFMRVQREKEREKAEKEKQRLEELQRQLDAQRRERIERVKQRGMPPIAANLLAKLADAREKQVYPVGMEGHRAPTGQFTFVSDLRPMLGRDGAVEKERTLKEEFKVKRNLWEQRSLESSQESSFSYSQPSTSLHARLAHESFSYAAAVTEDARRSQRERERALVRPISGGPSHGEARAAERQRRREEARSRAFEDARQSRTASRRPNGWR